MRRSQKSSLNTLSSRPNPFFARDSHHAEESTVNLHTDISSFSSPLHVPQSEGGAHAAEKAACHLGFIQTELPVVDAESVCISLDNQQIMMHSTIKDLLWKPAFVAFSCGACLIQIGYPVITTFLADYAITQDVTSTQSALLMSIFGSFNIIGRLLGGTLTIFGVDPLRLHNIMLFMGAVSCFFCPLYTSFWSLGLLAAAFGLFMGFFPPLQPLIIIEYFGLETLGTAFGFMSMIKGLATILGPPLGGWVYESTRNYSMSIIFGGSAILFSAIVHQTMICLKNE